MEILSSGVNTFIAPCTDAKDGQPGPHLKTLGISQPVVPSPPTSTARLSLLSQQLSAAAERAAVRDSQLSRKALAALASRIHEQIEGEQYWLFKDTYDAQRPDTDDAQWLERVQQATDFVNGKAPNPFKGMSREQLSLITHDQDGSFTINERRAASAEAGAQEFEWAKYIIDKMDAERRSTGRSDQAMLETIAHYDSLPRIDVAAHGNYEAAIRNTMQMHEFEVQLPTVGTSLLERLAYEWGDSDELPNSQLSGLATYSSAGMSAAVNDSAISTRDQSARVAVQQSPADIELSALAKQLHAAALRASARDSQLSRSELAELAARLNASLSGDNYAFAKDFYDAQTPTMLTPELMERARQATAFINGTGANPFLGMSRQQLSLIAYDEGSEFTFNERRAALWESSRQEAEWTRSVVGKMDIESQRTGRCTQGLKEIVSYYQSLPPIDEAQHGNYETQIARQASLEGIEWPEFRSSLIDLMANEWKIVDNPLDQQRPDASAHAPAAQKA